MAEGAGFLGRWSRRKLDAKEGKPLEEPALLPPPLGEVGGGGNLPPGGEEAETEPPVVESRPLPTLEDTRLLTPESDFKPFMAQDVAPEVKNAAMKKLFADPRFNVMDGLDTYIDDYSKPDPMPAAMLRQLASAKFLKMFDDEEKQQAPEQTEAQKPLGHGDDADTRPKPAVAQSDLCNTFPSPPDSLPLPASQNPDAHTDLRLQPDDAAAGREPERRPE